MPITKENLHEAFSYHPLDESQVEAYAAIQMHAEAFARAILEHVKPCGDQQAAIRHVFEAKATANRSIAVDGIV